jgi:PiT family inorganic phosphate transporter
LDIAADLTTTGSLVILVLALGMAVAFEFVNGFHDTANAVATIIYTHTLKPWTAVIWSGIWNFLGVVFSSGAVAFGILALLPVELVLDAGSSAGVAMVFALLTSAIVWNLGTWYLGLPASSSHTLIGSIMGVGIVNSIIAKGHSFGDGINWAKAREVFLSLLISPIIGFVCAGLLLLVMKMLIRRQELYTAPPKDTPPPPWIRGLLLFTCTGVSFSHGSNDGQKGMGLILLILIGLLPASYALNMGADAQTIAKLSATAHESQVVFEQLANAHPVAEIESEIDQADELSSYVKASGTFHETTFSALAGMNRHLTDVIGAKTSFSELPPAERRHLRKVIYLVGETLSKANKQHLLTNEKQQAQLMGYKGQLDGLTKFVPLWVKILVAVSLGCGTMIGWKRIVTTVGEKIGKSHLTYAQGASAELVAMTTIGLASAYGLPVSTTHVLSSGVAGTMVANGSGLQSKTLISILLAWVLTLPVCIILGSGIFAAGLYLAFSWINPQYG